MTPNSAWRIRGACGSDPDAWFPERGSGEAAKKICREKCPVRERCGLEALANRERHGIAAGFKMREMNERAQLRDWLGLPPDPEDSRKCRECGAPFETLSKRALCPACRGTVPVGPPSAHIRALKAAGWTWREIAAEAQVSVTMVRALAAGTGWHSMAKDKADRIQAIPVPVPQRAAS